MTPTSSGARSTAGQRSAQRSSAQRSSGQHSSDQPVKHVHHGRTPAAWAGSLLALIGFVIGGIGFVIPPHPNWVVVGIAIVLLVASLIATVVLRKLGHGAD